MLQVQLPRGQKRKISGVEVVKENVRMFWEGSGRLGRMNDGNRETFQMFRDSPPGRAAHYRKTSFRPNTSKISLGVCFKSAWLESPLKFATP